MSGSSIQLPITVGGVTSLNSETGAINIVAGSNITVTPAGQNITIASTGGGGGTPGGTDGQVQYNDSGAFGGSAITTDGTNLNLNGEKILSGSIATLQETGDGWDFLGADINLITGAQTISLTDDSLAMNSCPLDMNDGSGFGGGSLKLDGGTLVFGMGGDGVPITLNLNTVGIDNRLEIHAIDGFDGSVTLALSGNNIGMGGGPLLMQAGDIFMNDGSGSGGNTLNLDGGILNGDSSNAAQIMANGSNAGELLLGDPSFNVNGVYMSINNNNNNIKFFAAGLDFQASSFAGFLGTPTVALNDGSGIGGGSLKLDGGIIEGGSGATLQDDGGGSWNVGGSLQLNAANIDGVNTIFTDGSDVLTLYCNDFNVGVNFTGTSGGMNLGMNGGQIQNIGYSTSAPTLAANSEFGFSYNESTNAFTITVKRSDGVVKTGTVICT